MKDYHIGQLAKDVQVKTDTIRFYEKIGLMPKPLHTQSGYRHYTLEDLKRLRFIIRAKDMGFTLAEIKELLAIKISSKDTCEAVYIQSQNKIKIINQKMSELKKMKRALGQLMKQCHLENHYQRECPILDALEIEEEIS
jgi:Zn(II)-responsive transcriptional regulator